MLTAYSKTERENIDPKTLSAIAKQLEKIKNESATGYRTRNI